MLSKMIEDYPQSGRSQWILGDAFLSLGRVSDGLRSYRLAINILGPHYQLITEISKQLLEIERYRSAEGLLKYASSNSPEFPLAFSLLAGIRADYGDADGTERYARQSLALEDLDPTRHHLLAWALAAQGRWEEARAARARGLEQGRAFFWQQFMYEAYIRREEGDTAGAYAALDSAWTGVATQIGRATLDSVRVSEFGLESLLDDDERASRDGNR
jgi:tetratricopeptide (TPR) repeat protein